MRYLSGRWAKIYRESFIQLTGRKLADYSQREDFDFIGARGNINANASAEKITGIAEEYKKILRNYLGKCF
jgi:hypothetical protein